jgi:hypothetical protein
MSYATNLFSINWLFRINGTEERAQVGLHARLLSGVGMAAYLANFTADTTGAAALCTAMSNLWSNASGLNRGEYASLFGVKLAAIGTDGRYLADAYVYNMPTAVTGGSPNIVPASSVVVSLRTSETLGRANRGRLYLPYCAMSQGVAAATATVTTTNTLATAGKTFIQAVNTTLGITSPGTEIVIASKAGTGLNKVPASVRVGSVNDTQRRRRNRLVEVYSTQTL